MPDTQVSVIALTPLALTEMLERDGPDSFHMTVGANIDMHKLKLAHSSAIDCYL